MKTDHYKSVEKFMQLAGQDTPTKPTVLDEETRILRAKLIMEEALETVKALGVDADLFGAYSLVDCEEEINYTISGNYDFDMVEVADGCADISVVTIGTLIACGLPDGELLDMVDQNNLDKFGEGHYIREDGKLVKPPNHQPPDIKGWIGSL
jgi:predicted HAD superfamily Cof-like phosphohydrolase